MSSSLQSSRDHLLSSFLLHICCAKSCHLLSSVKECSPPPPMPLSCFMHWCCFSFWEYWAQFLGTCLDVLTSCTQLWIWSNWIWDPIWRHQVLSARLAGAVKMAASSSLLKSARVRINGRLMLWDPEWPIILSSIADITEPAAAIKKVYILYCVSHEVLLAAVFLMMEKITYRKKKTQNL